MFITFSQPVDLEVLIRSHFGTESIRGAIKSALVEGISTLGSARGKYLSFCSGKKLPELFDAEGAIVLVSSEMLVPSLVAESNIFLKVDNPRLMFIKFTSAIINGSSGNEQLHNGPSNSVIYGENCVIKDGAVIGKAGFGFERDVDGTPIRFPHFGRVLLGDNVEVGANTVISKGVIEDTLVGDSTKIDDLVYVAHNCKIGKKVMIAGNATLCGGVQIGDEAWIGAGASIKQNIVIGERATVGMGAVITRDVPAHSTVVGNPARVIKQAKQTQGTA